MTQQQTHRRDHDAKGQPVYIARKPVPYCVFGGFKMAFEDWTRTEDGWDCEPDFEGLPSTVFESREACEAAIASQAPVMQVAA